MSTIYLQHLYHLHYLHLHRLYLHHLHYLHHYIILSLNIQTEIFPNINNKFFSEHKQ